LTTELDFGRGSSAPTAGKCDVRALALAVIAFAPTAGASAAPEEFVIDPGHAFPSFEVRHLGIATQRGRFNRTTGTVLLDREAGVGSVEVQIDARSIDTGNTALDDLLRGPSFFDAGKFPEIRYKAAQVSPVEGQPTRVEGELTLLGVTKPVTLSVSNYQCTRKPFLVILRSGVDMSTTFRRSDFGMSAMTAFVSDEVTILIQAEAVRKARQEPVREDGM
jgi:polyisoprenoid-binding protein YceI